MGDLVARKTGSNDVVTTGHCCQGSTYTDQGSTDVIISGYGVVRKDDLDASHLLCTEPCGPSHQVAMSASMSTSVKANGKFIAMEGSKYGTEEITGVTQTTVFAT